MIIIENAKEITKITELAIRLLELKEEIKDIKKEEKRYKNQLRALMKKRGVKEIENDEISVQIRYPRSFDIGQFRHDYPEILDKYITIEKKMVETVETTLNEKDLKRFHPDEYEDCMVDGTPRIYIKRR